MRVHPTVTASTMIAQIFWGHKVRCHMEAVDFFCASLVAHECGTVESVARRGLRPGRYLRV
jgi:hypothetical protein